MCVSLLKQASLLLYIYSICIYILYVYLFKGDSKLGVYTIAPSPPPFKNPLTFAEPWGAFVAWSKRCSRVQSSSGVQNNEAGENGLGSQSYHKLHCNMRSAWCVTHGINKAANLHFCLWKLPSTSDSLFWQGYWLASALLPSNVFKHLIL